MKTSIKIITPEEAQMVLMNLNPYNYRKIDQSTVSLYAQDMENGNWKENGETVKFDINGNLIDGQHRIAAVQKSGIPQQFVVIEGLDPSVAGTIDIGRKKSIEQYLKWADKGYKQGATGIVQQVLVFDKGNTHMGQCAANSRISHMDIMDEYKNDCHGYNEAAYYGKTVNKECKAIKPKEAGTIFYYLTKRLGWDRQVVERMFFNLFTCRRNDKSIYATTLDCLDLKSGKERIMEYISCFNAMVKGCTQKRLQYSNWFLTPEEAKAA